MYIHNYLLNRKIVIVVMYFVFILDFDVKLTSLDCIYYNLRFFAVYNVYIIEITNIFKIILVFIFLINSIQICHNTTVVSLKY